MPSNKPAYSISDQILLLQSRGMIFKDEATANQLLSNISYYRLKGYWWDMQENLNSHTFKPNTYFEDIIDRYNFDRQLRLILFDGIERIEIALRTKMIYILSLKFGGLWYLDPSIFQNGTIEINGIVKTPHLHTVAELIKEFNRSQEIFIKDHRNRYPNIPADAWKILEVASMGCLSKLYKSLNAQLPEKSKIAQEMGFNIHSELSSWLEAITYLRNIIAHHSRLWSRTMVKKPNNLNNPKGLWFSSPLSTVQEKKIFLMVSALLYMCNQVTPGHHIKDKILKLFLDYPNVPIYKLGFLNHWEETPIWK